MSVPFPRWRDAIDAAQDDAARRALIGELLRWRATHLTDVSGQRDTAWALAEVASALNQNELARSEARTLRSLCQSSPAASSDEVGAAEALLARLDGRAGPAGRPAQKTPRTPRPDGERPREAREPRPPREAREPREPREARPPREAAPAPRPRPASPPASEESAETRAIRLGRAGQWSDAFAALKGRSGVTADLIRVWLDIGHARVENADRFLGAAMQRLERLVPDLALATPETRADSRPEPRPDARANEERPPRGESAREPRNRPERSEEGPREPSLGQLLAAVKEALAAPDVTADGLVPVVAPVRKLRELLDLVESLDGDDVGPRIEALLLAVHRTAPADVRVLQGTTIALRQAGRGDEDRARRLLIDGEAASRFGGPGAELLLQVAMLAQAAGWRLDRVLRGATRRERVDNAGLDALADSLDGLWRAVVRRGDAKAEVWVVDHLPAEGQAAVAQLALQPHRRLAILPESSDLADGWASLGGPRAVRWPADLAAELDAL